VLTWCGRRALVPLAQAQTGSLANAWTRRGLLFGGSAVAIIMVFNAAPAQRTAAPTVTPQNAPPPAEVIQWQTELATHLGQFEHYPTVVPVRFDIK
jgi:hypothetical protein